MQKHLKMNNFFLKYGVRLDQHCKQCIIINFGDGGAGCFSCTTICKYHTTAVQMTCDILEDKYLLTLCLDQLSVLQNVLDMLCLADLDDANWATCPYNPVS